LAIIDPEREGLCSVVHGSCEGRIGLRARGQGGFGYDPLFIVGGHGERSMAELSDHEKNRVSHRARAVHALRAVLSAWAAEEIEKPA
jgi:non-canonical purine NTP pyrophosphatase (RdgB/HAM1 family)